jgi:O-antigen/teichoic acid export membrane protein
VLYAYLAGKVISALGFSLAALLEAQRQWGTGWWKVSLGLLRPQARELTRFAVSTNLSATLSLINKDSELLWVSFLRSPLEAGFYKLALTLTNLVELPVNPMPQATYPELSRQAARNEWQNVRQVLRQGSLLVGAYSAFAVLVLVVIGQPLIRLVYGAEYLPAFPALIILLAGYLVANTFYWRRIALLTLGRADYPVKVNTILAILKVAGALLLVPRYGFLASAALLAGFYWLGSLFSFIKVRQLLNKKGVGACSVR